MNYWLFAGISAIGLGVITAKPELIAKIGLVRADALTKQNIRLLQAFFIAFAFVMGGMAISTSTDSAEKQRLSAADTTNSDISLLVSKIANAEIPVEISHRILMEGLSELDNIESHKAYITALETKVKRLFDAEALHCQRAYDKISEVKVSIVSLSVDQETKTELISITEAALNSYSMRRKALMKASSSIDELDYKTKSLPDSLVKEAILDAKKSQEKTHEAALRLAALCTKLGITPAQK